MIGIIFHVMDGIPILNCFWQKIGVFLSLWTLNWNAYMLFVLEDNEEYKHCYTLISYDNLFDRKHIVQPTE